MKIKGGPGSWLRRMALVVLGALVASLLLESGLQVLRLLHRLPEPERWLRTRDRVILCAGDSHTYGLGVDTLQTYPVRLAGRLNGWRADGPFEVINYGRPGFNTAQVSYWLREAVESCSPDLVLLLAGYNNCWNPTQPPDLDETARPADPPVLILPKLVHLLLFNRAASRLPRADLKWEGDRPFIEDRAGRKHYINDDPEAKENARVGNALTLEVRNDLLGMVAFCRERATEVCLLTYPYALTSLFESVNAGARLAAQESATPLIDLAAQFEDPSIRFSAAFQPDGHPTGYGCDWIAELIHRALLEDPRTAAFRIAAEDPRRPIQESRPAKPPFLVQQGGSPGGSLVFDLEGPPGGNWLLAISAIRLPSPASNGLRLSVSDDVFRQCWGRADLNGWFDDQGCARAVLHPRVYAPFAGQEVFVQLLLRDPFAQEAEKAVIACSESEPLAWPK